MVRSSTPVGRRLSPSLGRESRGARETQRLPCLACPLYPPRDRELPIHWGPSCPSRASFQVQGPAVPRPQFRHPPVGRGPPPALGGGDEEYGRQAGKQLGQVDLVRTQIGQDLFRTFVDLAAKRTLEKTDSTVAGGEYLEHLPLPTPPT